ncbi:MAG: polysaccharide biosynthesis tyrosine autokinase [Flavobacteriales bacterium]|nr:polysaccharide biosynthesis tyrosine autokinase [Flavobacteriales bacterium]
MSELENISDSEKKIDIKSLIKKFTGYWYYFLISVLICLFLAFLYNRYNRNVYKVYTYILIEDEKNQADEVFELEDMFGNNANLENQKAILKSHTLAKKTIQEMDIQVSYFQYGKIKKVNLYKKSPFYVYFDENYNQLSGVEFFINLKNKEEFELEYKCENKNTYNIKTNKKTNKKISDNYRKSHKFNELIDNDFIRLKIVKDTSVFNYLDINNINEYSFILHSLDKLAANYVEKIKVSPLSKESTVLELRMDGYTRNKNVDYLNTLSKLYLEDELSDKNEFATHTLLYIEGELSEAEDTLVMFENQLKVFKQNNLELDIVTKDFGTFKQKLDVEEKYQKIRDQLRYYNSLLNYVKSDYIEKETNEKTHTLSPTSIGILNPELNALIIKLMELNSKKKGLELSIEEGHPKYQAILSDISFTKQSIIENVANLISSTKTIEKDLKSRILTTNNQIEKLPEAEQELWKITRNIDHYKTFVNYLTDKKLNTNILIEGTTSDHKIIDSAMGPEIPLSPNRKVNLLFALILGVGIPVIIISLRDFLNETILSKSDLTKITNIPIIGVIGNSDKSNNLVVLDNPKSVISESFRSLRTNIQYLSSEIENKVITITSSVGSEGKTFCTSNLALIMATAGYKTILIGADLRKPKTHEVFNLDNSLGLSSYLINKSTLSEIVHNTDAENLRVIPSGPIPPNPSELLNSDRMKKLIKELKKTYDYIILDTPPCGLVTDSVITMKMSDINLYIVRHNYTKENMLSIINDLHDTEQVKNINIIINDYIVSSSSYGYGYGYGYGNGYGYYE